MGEQGEDSSFEVSVVMHDNHCGGCVDMVLEEVEHPLDFDGVDREDPEAVSELLRSIVDDIDDGELDVSDELTTQLRDALDGLEPCAEHRCDCHNSAWEGDKDLFDELLAGLGSNRWAVRDHCDDGRGFISDLSVSTLFEMVPVSSNYGFDDVSLSWDGATLKVSFSGYPWGSHGLELVECVGVRDELYDRYDDWLDSHETVAAMCFEPDEFVARLVALHVEVHGPDDGEGISYCELAEVVRADLDRSPAAVALLIEMQPGWPGSITELITAVNEMLCVAA
jgi:hypothetical protein